MMTNEIQTILVDQQWIGQALMCGNVFETLPEKSVLKTALRDSFSSSIGGYLLTFITSLYNIDLVQSVGIEIVPSAYKPPTIRKIRSTVFVSSTDPLKEKHRQTMLIPNLRLQNQLGELWSGELLSTFGRDRAEVEQYWLEMAQKNPLSPDSTTYIFAGFQRPNEPKINLLHLGMELQPRPPYEFMTDGLGEND